MRSASSANVAYFTLFTCPRVSQSVMRDVVDQQNASRGTSEDLRSSVGIAAKDGSSTQQPRSA